LVASEAKQRPWFSRVLVLGWLALAGFAACSGNGGSGRGTAGEAGAAGPPSEAGTGPNGTGAAAGASDEPGSAGTETGLGGNDSGASGGMSDAGSGDSAGNGGGPQHIPPGSGKLGSPCIETVDCKLGLTCFTDTTLALNGGSAPHGLCSIACSTANNAPCEQQSAGSLCVPFDSSTPDQGICVEGCVFGPATVGAQKCHGRSDFACMPALLSDTGAPCLGAGDCFAGELCNGTCLLVFPGCMPSCRGDLDCPAGLFCDQSFLSGVCVAQAPTGKRLGEPCNVPSVLDPAEPDQCLGFCQEDSPGSPLGHCSATCGLLNECAWDPASERFDGGCFYASVLTEDSGAVGDFGFCTPSCNCDAECNDASLVCMAATGIGLLAEDRFKGPGLCFSPVPNELAVDQCQ
jgi:hypothetical protein